MKILTHCYEFPPIGGGGAKVVFGLSKDLIELGHEVDLVTMKFRTRTPTGQIAGLRVHKVPCIRTSQFICYAPELATYIAAAIPFSLRLVKNQKYHINHTHFVFPDGVVSWILKKRTGLPFILSVHGSDIPGYNPDRFIGLHKLLFPLWKKVVGSASQVVSPSETVKALVQRHAPTVPVTVIPWGFDVSRFRPDQQKRPCILAVSRLFERKGIQYFLKALADFEGRGDYEVNIVGDGPYRQALQRMAGDLNLNIKFWGHLNNDSPELTNLFSTSSIFVFPSDSENFPIVLLEAMSAELAIITTKSTGCGEVVGETGILVNPGDVQGITKALVELTSNPDLCRRLGQSARKRVEAHFTWTIVAKRYIELYKKHSLTY